MEVRFASRATRGSSPPFSHLSPFFCPFFSLPSLLRTSDIQGTLAVHRPFYISICISICIYAYAAHYVYIGIIAAGGYRGKVNQSLIALIWLDEINVEIGDGLEYKCSRNGEKKN